MLRVSDERLRSDERLSNELQFRSRLGRVRGARCTQQSLHRKGEHVS